MQFDIIGHGKCEPRCLLTEELFGILKRLKD